MQSNYYVFENEACSIRMDKMPVWFQEKESNGYKDKGTIIFHTTNNYDEIWGANAKMEITWEKKERTEAFHAKLVQNSIDRYSAVEVTITNKELIWVRSHECTIWYGTRTKMIRKHFYRENSIHAVLYCDISEREFNFHTSIVAEHFQGFKPYVLEAYNAIICH